MSGLPDRDVDLLRAAGQGTKGTSPSGKGIYRVTGVSATASGTALCGCPCACLPFHGRNPDPRTSLHAVPALITVSLEHHAGVRGFQVFGAVWIVGLGRYAAK